MRSGRPMLAVPSCNDQLDNADHVRRLEIARVVHQKRLTVGRAARELERLLSEPSFGRRAESVASRLSREHGATAAVDALELACGWSKA